MCLDPGSENLPHGGIRKWEAQKSDADYQNAANPSGAVQFARGPQIVQRQQEEEAVRGTQNRKDCPIEKCDVKTGENG
jgi:hypothetical protein